MNEGEPPSRSAASASPLVLPHVASGPSPDTTSEPLLIFEQVLVRSGEGRTLLDRLDWSLSRDARVRVEAPRRECATMFLRAAAGLVHPQAGRIVLDGVPLDPRSFEHPFLRRGGIGWVPRGGGLLVNQSLLDNAVLPLMFVRGMGRSEAESAATRALESARLAPVAHHRPHALDPRERWLGALVRAELMQPELWLVEFPPGRPDTAAVEILDRAFSASAAMILAGGDAWDPGEEIPTLALNSSGPVPEEA